MGLKIPMQKKEAVKRKMVYTQKEAPYININMRLEFINLYQKRVTINQNMNQHFVTKQFIV